MSIVGIVGSPRKKGRTNELVSSALHGAKSADKSTEKSYLIDYNINPYTGNKPSGEDALQYCPKELSSICSEADAIILGAPVYWGGINGLTRDFMDGVRISNSNGKYALGISIAGGTGKGLISGVQSIYHFFYHKQLRGKYPTPVSRFNFERTLDVLERRGNELAKLSTEENPFPGKTRADRWPSVGAHYAALEYVGLDIVDEFIMLASDLIKESKGGDIDRAKTHLQKAKKLITEERPEKAVEHAFKSYQTLHYPPNDKFEG